MKLTRAFLIAPALVAAACSACSPQAKSPSQSANPMLLKLKVCGMDVSKVTLVEEPKSERYIVLRDHPAMDRRGLECIANALIQMDYGLRTSSWASEQDYIAAFNAAQDKRLHNWAKDWLAHNRPNLVHASYRTGQSLQSYSQQIGAICGAPKGYVEVFRKNGMNYVATNGRNASQSDVENVSVQTRECMDAVIVNGLPPQVATWLGGGGVP